MIKVPEKADDGRLRERERCNDKRVLYGTYAEKTVSFEWPGERTWGTGEFVVDFIPTFYKEQEDFTAQYCVPGVLDALKHAGDHCITYERKPATLLLTVNSASQTKFTSVRVCSRAASDSHSGRERTSRFVTVASGSR